jgi:non-specific serine/threonine protein kinase/serine/threonine-protein kinase
MEPTPYASEQLSKLTRAVRSLDELTDVGPYHIVKPLGTGGMGIVYLAEQREPIQRSVAIKVIKLGMDTKEVISRFEAERQALAMMDHPNVARVIDAGATSDGRPYFVMEYVDGEAITSYCDRHRLTIEQRLELFRQACDAIQHAHQKAIVHRDIKPSNILVTQEQGKPWVKVIDFGVAKAIERRLTQQTMYTEAGQFIGTLEYMSPEQADARGKDIDTRTDVYSLGVVLYELLTGAVPFDAVMLRTSGYAQVQRIISEVEPPRPSTKLSHLGAKGPEVAQARQVPLEVLDRQLHRELDWIPLKAMKKAPSERYSSVIELSDDIANYLARRPLRAGPDTTEYRLRKFILRNKRGVAATAALFLLLIAGTIATTYQAIRATRAERRALAEKAEAERRRAEADDAKAASAQVNDFLVGMFESVDPQFAQSKPVLVRDVLDKASKDVGPKLAGQPRVESAVRSALGRTYFALAMYDAAEEHFTKALELDRRALGDDDPQTLISQQLLGRLRRVQGRLPEARRTYEDTLARRRRVLGENHLDTIGSMNDLAVALDQLGLPEAEAMYREARNRHLALAGPDHLETLRLTGNLGQYLTRVGKYEESERLLRESYEGRRRKLGDDHPDTINISTRLAFVMKYRNAWDQAEALMRDALARCLRVFGENHPNTVWAENGLAQLLVEQGKHDEGVARYLHALEQSRKVLGREHVATLGLMQSAAAALSNADRLDEGVTLEREAVAGLIKARGPDHPTTILAETNLANMLLDQQHWADAQPLAKDCYERLRAPGRIPLEPSRRAVALCAYGVCLAKLGRHEEAIEPLTVAREALRQSGDADRHSVEAVLQCLLDSSRTLNRADDAARWADELGATRAATRPATKP